LAEAGYPEGFSVRLDCPNNRYVNDEPIRQAARPGTIEEISRVMLFAADPLNSWVNGIDIQVDGGMGSAGFAEQFAEK
jgi:NAD(P)-dependent dehydrogenase (short-subunit alcohol dehydrogenase family)